jgi:hypothetical protein
VQLLGLGQRSIQVVRVERAEDVVVDRIVKALRDKRFHFDWNCGPRRRRALFRLRRSFRCFICGSSALCFPLRLRSFALGLGGVDLRLLLTSGLGLANLFLLLLALGGRFALGLEPRDGLLFDFPARQHLGHGKLAIRVNPLLAAVGVDEQFAGYENMFFLLRQLAVDDGSAVELRHVLGVDVGHRLLSLIQDDIDPASRLVDVRDLAVAIGRRDLIPYIEGGDLSGCFGRRRQRMQA